MSCLRSHLLFLKSFFVPWPFFQYFGVSVSHTITLSCLVLFLWKLFSFLVVETRLEPFTSKREQNLTVFISLVGRRSAVPRSCTVNVFVHNLFRARAAVFMSLDVRGSAVHGFCTVDTDQSKRWSGPRRCLTSEGEQEKRASSLTNLLLVVGTRATGGSVLFTAHAAATRRGSRTIHRSDVNGRTESNRAIAHIFSFVRIEGTRFPRLQNLNLLNVSVERILVLPANTVMIQFEVHFNKCTSDDVVHVARFNECVSGENT